MAYLLQILIAVGLQAAAQMELGLAAIPAVWSLPLLLVPHALGALSRRTLLGGHFRLGARQARLLRHLGVLTFGALMLGTDWLEQVRAWTGAQLGIDSWPEFAAALSFAPFVILQALSIDADTRLHCRPGREQRAARALGLRMFMTTLLPLGLYVGVMAAIGASPQVRVLVEEVGLFNGLFLVLVLGTMTLGLPSLITNAWRTEPLPPGLRRDVLDAVARKADFTCKDVRIWQTGGLVTNAAIVGVGPRRVVLFSDALLAALGPRELASVYGHEIGHAKCHHVPLFLAWALAFFLGADLLAPQSALWGSVVLVGVLGLWALCFGWLSRRSELEADLYSLDLLGDPAAMISALERVGDRLRDVGSWRHFSPSIRCRFVERAAKDREFVRRFRTRLRRIAWLGVLALLVTGGLELHGMVGDYASQRTRADLVLGDYASAASRAARLGEEDEELRALAQLAQDLPPGADLEQDVEEALLAALEAGDLERAAGWATLLAWRGHGPAQDLVRLLKLGELEADLDQEEAELRAGLPDSWKDHL